MEILLSVAPSSVGVIPSCSVVRTYSKKVLGTVALEMAALGTVASRENPSTLSESPTRRCITLQVTKPIVRSSLSPPSPPPMGSDHSSDGNYVAKPSANDVQEDEEALLDTDGARQVGLCVPHAPVGELHEGDLIHVAEVVEMVRHAIEQGARALRACCA